MDDPLAVRGAEGLCDLRSELDRLLDAQRARREAIGEALALHVLHDQVVDPVLRAYVVERADARVVEARDHARLPLEPRLTRGVTGDLGMDDLEATVRASRVSRAR